MFQILFVLSAIVLGFVGVSRLSLNVSLMKLLPDELPGVKGTLAFQDLQERPNELLVTLQSFGGEEIADLAEMLAERLAMEPRLATSVQFEPAWRAEPQGMAELAAHAWLNAPPEKVLGLEAALATDQIDALLRGRLETISGTFNPLTAAVASRDPLGLGAILAPASEIDAMAGGGDEFASSDGAFHVIKVEAPPEVEGYRGFASWLTKVRAVVAAWQEKEGSQDVKVAYTGSPAFEAEIGMGMERDMNQSVSGISFLVGLLFWLLHRRIQPLIYLMLAILATGMLTLGVAGLTFGTLDVMSMGFAAILMGMIEDFGVMGLNEAMRRPEADYRSVHAAVFPSVAWSAVTSAAVFGILGLSALPGIAKMGILTALGILIGAAVMLYGFLPLAMRGGSERLKPLRSHGRRNFSNGPGWLALALILACGAAILSRGLPGTNNNTEVLRPRHCQAFDALEQLQAQLQPNREETLLLPVIVEAKSANQLAASMRQLEERLATAAAKNQTSGHFLPTAMTPDPERQAHNLPVLSRLSAERERLMEELDAVGFTSEGMAFPMDVLDVWGDWGRDQTAEIHWPSTHLLEKFIGPVLRRDASGITACGFVLLPRSADLKESRVLREIQQDSRVQVGGLEYLTQQLKELLVAEVRRVLLPAVAVLGGLMFLVFRNTRERVLVVGSLAFSGFLLLGVMSATGMKWNFVNIGAVPLALGLGLDFNIHMIHALGKRGADGHGIGRALAYCGLSTGLGFGALAFSDNVGLATFGMTSMIGVLSTLLTAAILLPWAWRRLAATPED